MINNSLSAYLFIQACIYFLHYIAPLSAFYCIIVLILRPSAYRIPLLLEIWAVAETSFFSLLYVPRNILLQHAATHPEVLPRDRRRKLFGLCQQTIQDPELYLRQWFKGAPLSEIKRENVKQLYSWAFLNKGDHGPEDEEELDEYADQTDVLLGYKLEPGRGNATSLRVTLDEVKTLYRSL